MARRGVLGACGLTRARRGAQVPTCYMMNPPRLQPGHFAKFQLETLMYVFYSMPGDEAQVFAADELAVRGWWFHKEFKARRPGSPPPALRPRPAYAPRSAARHSEKRHPAASARRAARRANCGRLGRGPDFATASTPRASAPALDSLLWRVITLPFKPVLIARRCG